MGLSRGEGFTPILVESDSHGGVAGLVIDPRTQRHIPRPHQTISVRIPDDLDRADIGLGVPGPLADQDDPHIMDILQGLIGELKLHERRR